MVSQPRYTVRLYNVNIRTDSTGRAFEQHRHRLWGVAYRMLGSHADADDMVQEAYLRWHRAAPEEVRAPQAWLVTTTTRLCIDRLRAVKREEYIGQWLPEPVPESWAGAAADCRSRSTCRR